MSTLALKKLEEQLKCAICLEDYKDPKLLQCFHVFCQNCLEDRRMVVQNEEGGRSVLCPTCRQATPIPPSGVSGLQSAFYISHLSDIQESFKKGQDSASGEREGASNITTPSKKILLYCPEHANKELELYCQTCEKPICSKCIYRGGKHHSHDYEEISKAFERYKEEVTPSLESMEKQKKRIIEALTELGTRRDEISNQRQTIEADIHNAIGRLHTILEVRETELIGQLHAMTQGKMKNLAAQEDHLETLQAQLSSCLLFLEKNLKRGSEGNVLMMKKTVVKQVKELTAPFKADTLKPKTEANMATSFSADVIGVCQKFGEIHGSPSQRHALPGTPSILPTAQGMHHHSISQQQKHRPPSSKTSLSSSGLVPYSSSSSSNQSPPRKLVVKTLSKDLSSMQIGSSSQSSASPPDSLVGMAGAVDVSGGATVGVPSGIIRNKYSFASLSSEIAEAVTVTWFESPHNFVVSSF